MALLAEKMRPQTLEEWVGHPHLMQPGKVLYEAIKNDRLFSFILYAPSGCGHSSYAAEFIFSGEDQSRTRVKQEV